MLGRKQRNDFVCQRFVLISQHNLTERRDLLYNGSLRNCTTYAPKVTTPDIVDLYLIEKNDFDEKLVFLKRDPTSFKLHTSNALVAWSHLWYDLYSLFSTLKYMDALHVGWLQSNLTWDLQNPCGVILIKLRMEWGQTLLALAQKIVEFYYTVAKLNEADVMGIVNTSKMTFCNNSI